MKHPILHVVSVSGGKDSAATAILALETQPRDALRFVFADTGNEDQQTIDWIRLTEDTAACSSAYGLCE